MEAIGLVAVFILMSMLLRWLVVHDDAPGKKNRGLFAMREPGDLQGDAAANQHSIQHQR